MADQLASLLGCAVGRGLVRIDRYGQILVIKKARHNRPHFGCARASACHHNMINLVLSLACVLECPLDCSNYCSLSIVAYQCFKTGTRQTQGHRVNNCNRL
eukprot:comp21264_c0_seq1/m.45497 comp21264_c0_seq1/g.45497  ORF comp21264_c0_seq1/g.45497 comp21264_c0_seq1/m.45497 type:complete len:101 (+) comp21264_c0_seq1:1772-2074(+)